MYVNWIKKIGNFGPHNAFTDLCEFKGELYCCYREAQNHVSRDGAIRIITTNFNGHVIRITKVSLRDTDLRDPKLSVTPQGDLLLVAFARLTNEKNATLLTRNLNWISQTGHTWSCEKEFADHSWWLWRVTWYNKLAYGFAYNRNANAINLYRGNPRRTFELHQASVLSLEKHGKGYPNESDMCFINNKAYAIIRRDADTYSAQLGVSHSPFKKWTWLDLKAYIGGPAMIPLNQEMALVAGRIVQGNKLVTALLSINLNSGKLTKLLVLPSAGDNSYPGLIFKNDSLYMSYYSSHENNKSSIYLAQINMQNTNLEISE